ncbi:YpbS family protein [Paenibacillus alkalitolerans]|uniref:YpbS family protein n=1 Tax=Paenibacillus alkalitolerans TaxID=2799335 RepID=UPI0018F4DAB1|nr:YpbS family protein [Paenibacillus alkalitolerans]
MKVHQAISDHSRKQYMHLARFQDLDRLREEAIDAAVSLCKQGEPFDVDAINAITAQINEHAKHGISPTRQIVTKEMVAEYVRKL